MAKKSVKDPSDIIALDRVERTRAEWEADMGKFFVHVRSIFLIDRKKNGDPTLVRVFTRSMKKAPFTRRADLTDFQVVGFYVANQFSEGAILRGEKSGR